MPTNGAARGTSALSGFGLFLTALVCCYLNTTTSAFFWSTLYFGAIGVFGLGMSAKWAAALGVENKLSVFFDKVASILPWAALFFTGFQTLQYTSEGLNGFMAGIAFLALIFNVCFGLLDSITTVLGQKYKDLSETLADAQHRVQAAHEALRGGDRH